MSMLDGLFSVARAAVSRLSYAGGAYDKQQNIAPYYSTEGDGGGGIFEWRGSSTATADDGTVVAVSGVTVGRWHRLYSQVAALYCTDLDIRVGAFDRAVVTCDGRAASGDGGGGDFVWDLGSSTTRDAVFVWGTQSDGRWKRIDRMFVTPEMFGATGDGTTDDTIAYHLAVDYVKSRGIPLDHIPGKKYRLTSGYTQSNSYNDIYLRGCGRVGELVGQKAAIVYLDAASAGSFFLSVTARCTLRVEGLIFQCAQLVQDRKFFKLSGGLVPHFFENCSFHSCNKAVVYEAGLYFQGAVFRDVQFVTSGTIHSEFPDVTGINGLAGSLLTISNVNHEGYMPVNTDKTVMNLQGVRRVVADNLLLEGALYSTGWTILKLGNPYDSEFTRAPYATFRSYHSEWAGAYPASYAVHQDGGSVYFDQLYGLDANASYKLTSHGRVVVTNSSFSELDEPSTWFKLEDGSCTVELQHCAVRSPDWTVAGITHHDTLFAEAGLYTHPTLISNDASQELYRWDGGYVGAGGAILSQFGGGTNTPSTDASYGRKLLLIPSAGALDTTIKVTTNAVIGAGDQVIVLVRAKLPTYASGLWGFGISNASGVVRYKYFDSSYAGTVVDVLLAMRLEAASATVGAYFSNGTTSGASGNVEVYSLAIYQGQSTPRRLLPVFPLNIITFNTAAPAAGAWKVGDITKNSAPSVGTAKGWICTVSGTPGTWVSEGNL